jgi:hypothetical protein
MTAIPLHSKVQKAYQDHGVEWIFNNLLNWNPASQSSRIIVGGKSCTVEVVRELSGFKLLKVTPESSLSGQ